MNDKKRCPIRTHFKKALKVLNLYLDDLLLVGGSCCFVAAAGDMWGRPAALAAAGVWLCIFAMVVARSRRGGG